MAVIANTFKTYEAKGIREDLANVIHNISPEDTPFQANAKRGKCKQTLSEWQTDALAAADTANAQLEGDDVSSFDAVTPTVRLGNYTQISRKTLIVADTEEVVDKAGRKSEEAYQIAKKGAELKRDVESILLANQAANAGAAGTARKTGSMLAFIKTNTSVGAGGVDPVYTTVPNDVRTDGTPRAFTEAMLKDVIKQCFDEGASPDTLMVGSFNKQAASAFAGIAEHRVAVKGAAPTTIIGAADVYVSDFGNVSIVPNRFQRARDAFVLDFDYAEIAWLRPIKRVALAKTGDAEKSMLIGEYMLRVGTEKAHGLIADLTTS